MVRVWRARKVEVCTRRRHEFQYSRQSGRTTQARNLWTFVHPQIGRSRSGTGLSGKGTREEFSERPGVAATEKPWLGLCNVAWEGAGTKGNRQQPARSVSPKRKTAFQVSKESTVERVGTRNNQKFGRVQDGQAKDVLSLVVTDLDRSEPEAVRGGEGNIVSDFLRGVARGAYASSRFVPVTEERARKRSA